MTCVQMSPGVHVCRPDGIVQPVPRRRPKRWWCFQCRQHLVHRLMWKAPTAPSYYGPTPPWWECQKRHEEHVLFPGREWVYDA